MAKDLQESLYRDFKLTTKIFMDFHDDVSFNPDDTYI